MEFSTEKKGRKCESNIPIKLNTVEKYKKALKLKTEISVKSILKLLT